MTPLIAAEVMCVLLRFKLGACKAQGQLLPEQAIVQIGYILTDEFRAMIIVLTMLLRLCANEENWSQNHSIESKNVYHLLSDSIFGKCRKVLSSH